jgi:hypothetical protein
MPKGGIKAAEQLKAFIELQSKQAKLAAPLLKLAGYDIDASLPLDNPVVWVSCARHALTLDDKNETDALLKRAFREFDLDPDNPFDWRRLLAWAAFFLFAAKKQSGRPTEWDAKRYCELLEAVDRRKQGNPQLSDKKACEIIAKDRASPLYFRKVKANGLRNALQRARSIGHNDAIRVLVEFAIPRAKQQAEQAGVEWTTIERAWMAEAANVAARDIGSRWRRTDKIKEPI